MLRVWDEIQGEKGRPIFFEFVKGFLISSCLLLPGTFLSAAEYFNTTIDFGTVSYNVSKGNFSTITVTDAGVISTGGTNKLISRSGGSAGNYAITNWQTFEWRILINVKEPGSSSYTISTPGCGTVTISNITMTGGATDLELNRHWQSKDYVLNIPLGATLSFDSFEGTGACMISGFAPAALHYETRDGIIVKSEGDLDVPIQLYVVPVMTLSHDNGAALDFGRFCASPSEQILTINPDGTISHNDLACDVPDTSPDSFTVEGVTGATFMVNLPAGVILFGNHQGYLTLSDLTSSCPPEGCTIESGTSKQFTVGATLVVPANPIGGRYNGTYIVRVTY